MIMNTQYLIYALEVERVGSISQAAQNLYIAQPNLSKSIKDLEKELGFPLFKRTSNGVQVTEAGSEFLYHAKQIAEQLDAISRIQNRSGHGKLYYKLSIPRGSYIAEGFTSFISELEAEKGMEVTLNETNSLGTISNVADRGYNVGIIRYPVSDETYFLSMLKNNHLQHEIIWEFEYVLVMSTKHPLADKEEISVSDLDDYIQISHGDVNFRQDKNINSKNTHEHNKTIYVYERGSQFDLLTNVPTTYMWVSPIPKHILEKNNLVQRNCKVDNNTYRDVVIFRKDYHLEDIDRLFQKKIYESKVDVSI